MTGAEPVTDRRGGDSRARRNAAEMNRQSLKRQTPPTCHCEGASCPWQSREGTCSPYRPPSKRHAPIASVAALTAQPLAALPPYGCGVPLAGCERLAGCRFGGTPPTAPALVGERHAAPGDALAICTNRRQNGKRSRLVIPRSEATWESPATGYVFAEAHLLSNMVLRDCHVGLRPPRNDKPSAFAVLLTACLLHQCSAGSGMPLPYNGVCDQRECLPEIATGAKRPRNDTSGKCLGAPAPSCH